MPLCISFPRDPAFIQPSSPLLSISSSSSTAHVSPVKRNHFIPCFKVKSPSFDTPNVRKMSLSPQMSAKIQISPLEELVLALHQINAIKFGDFVLKSGITSPIYIDLRVTISYPYILTTIAGCLNQAVADAKAQHDLLCGVPYTALPFATVMTLQSQKPMLMRRKEAKSYGTKKIIEGVFQKGQRCLVVEDLVTSGLSVLETVQPLRELDIIVENVVVLIDRQQGARENLQKNGINLISVFTITDALDILIRHKKIDPQLSSKVREFLQNNQVPQPIVSIPTPSPKKKRISYEEKMSLIKNQVGQRLLRIILSKQSNLAFSADVKTEAELLTLADQLGPQICCLKTHADIISDWNPDTGSKLRQIADRHNFLIFEDRKFADIGNTVVSQCTEGVHRIASWADIINAHTVPGPGVISGLRKATAISKRDMALLLLAEMSSEGNLATALPAYKEKSVVMAKENSDFVIGFISMAETPFPDSQVPTIVMTPGVQLASTGDGLGQQYATPESVITEKGSDVIIVGRGIYASDDPIVAATTYKQAGWDAYMAGQH